ncbi:hypothetical protein D3C80_1935460 [compost metagenome]
MIPIMIRDTTSEMDAKATRTIVIPSIIPLERLVTIAAKSVYTISSSLLWSSFHLSR